MLNIINSMLFRIKKTTVFWILLGLCVFLPILNTLINVGASSMLQSILEGLEGLEGTGLEDAAGLQTDFLAAGGTAANISADLSILVIVAVAVIVGNEYSFGTIRNAVLANKSRSQLFFAYAIVSSVVVVALTATYMLVCYTANVIAFDSGNYKIGEIFASIFTSFGLAVLSNIFVATMTLFFVVATHKKSSSILFPILICQILPGLILIAVLISVMVGNITSQTAGWIPFVNYFFYDGSAPDGFLAMQISVINLCLIATFGGFGYLLTTKKDLN